MKKVRSSLNLDLDLFLARAGAPVGVFALGRTCLAAREDGLRPACLAVRIEGHLTSCWQLWLPSGLQLGRAWEACCCGGVGIVHSVFGVLFLPVSWNKNNNRTERGLVDRALVVN